MSPLQLIKELEKYDFIKTQEFQRRLLGTVRPPKANRSKSKTGILRTL